MKFFKKCLAGVLLTSMVGAAHASTTLTFGEPAPNRGARAADVQWFADQVEKRSGGDLKIDIQWGGALFKAKAARDAISTGVADMGSIIQGYFPQELITTGIGDLPFDNQDPWVGIQAINEFVRDGQVSKQLSRQNLHLLTSYSVGPVNLICKDQPITSLKDLDGKKLRGIGVYGHVLGDNGASQVNMSVYKVYQGLDTGLIDCAQTYLSASAALKHDEVSKYITKLNWGIFSGLGIYINQDMYQSLSPSQRKVLEEVSADFANHHGRNVIINDVEGEKKLVQNGMISNELPAEVSQTLIDQSEAYFQDWVAKANATGLDGARLLKKYEELVAKYKHEKETLGYPWER